jgi:hypothetical protein
MTSKTGQCTGCKALVTGFLHRQFSESGAETFLWRCGVCDQKGCFGQPFFIAKNTIRLHLTEEQIELLPIIMPHLYSRCGRCGARGCEEHHWAPIAIFGQEEADKWPKDFLCKTCHDEWHRMVTPQLVL